MLRILHSSGKVPRGLSDNCTFLNQARGSEESAKSVKQSSAVGYQTRQLKPEVQLSCPLSLVNM